MILRWNNLISSQDVQRFIHHTTLAISTRDDILACSHRPKCHRPLVCPCELAREDTIRNAHLQDTSKKVTLAESFGYAPEDLSTIREGANLSVICGNANQLRNGNL